VSKRRSDEVKKAAIADYISGMTLKEVGAKYSVSHAAVKKWVDANPEVELSLRNKKEENTKKVLEYMDEKVEGLKKFVDYYFERLDKDMSKESLDQLNEVQLTTIFGVLIDKFLKVSEIRQKQQESDTQAETVVIRFDIPRD